jgi:hypothetical protein
VTGGRSEKKERNLHRKRGCRDREQRSPQQRRPRSSGRTNRIHLASRSQTRLRSTELNSPIRNKSTFNPDLILLKPSRNADRLPY